MSIFHIDGPALSNLFNHHTMVSIVMSIVKLNLLHHPTTRQWYLYTHVTIPTAMSLNVQECPILMGIVKIPMQ